MLETPVTLVTGGTSGIGAAVARNLSSRSHTVVAASRVMDDRQRSAPLVARWHSLDVADEGSVNRVVDAIVEEYGKLDNLVHCAGILERVDVMDMSFADWRRVLAANLDGTFLVTRAVSRQMRNQVSGSIVLLASDRGIHGLRSGAHYAASKGAIIAYMKSLALELGALGVTVNAISPGTTDTGMARQGLSAQELEKRQRFDPLGKIGSPDDIAEIVAFLLGPARTFMTGQLISTRMRAG